MGALPAAALLPGQAFAAYPDHPIHLIVPFAAGGNADIVGRLVGNEMGKALKQTVVVENRGGAGGGVGAQAVAKSAPDGYTLLVGSNGPLTINPLMHKNLGYNPEKDFAAVALTSYVPHALILANKTPIKSIADFVAASKKTPMTIATSGVGSASHMTLEAQSPNSRPRSNCTRAARRTSSASPRSSARSSRPTSRPSSKAASRISSPRAISASSPRPRRRPQSSRSCRKRSLRA
jgi:hypothetical protein